MSDKQSLRRGVSRMQEEARRLQECHAYSCVCLICRYPTSREFNPKQSIHLADIFSVRTVRSVSAEGESMQLLLAGLFACGCVSLVDALPWPAAETYINPLAECSQSSDPGACRTTRDSWKTEYADAIAGKYQGQRNVAFCLSTGCDNAIQPDKILGCAWQIVIAKSGHLERDGTDAANLKHFCGSDYIDQARRQAADAQAKTMSMMIGK
ncbi:hypothetical protein [Rhizobium mayense]|uniref:Uncharacterized protein n=1 Tax=Rhizobium mayense TaxID=1312184 RepID=A0ABT7JWI7_9HYPH|nr:hypothetical protein [Rhizobium mayense]MDL2400708.1 hypothetical protein [Rhizobium mayense]